MHTFWAHQDIESMSLATIVEIGVHQTTINLIGFGISGLRVNIYICIYI